ncbi:FXYD domain-containing ion transport regulator 7 isoform X3 [Felis catus]|uniref:FXYD domain-containing ion transport regulator 7 isoform X3 n=1 Tax=Felis catus TaxID=9685 RepID=UPI001D19FE4D|nr:FXYD domain-containing ion transport regulator 7 isoform X3 [Felis catus]
MRWLGGSVAPHPFHPHRIPLAPGAPHPPPEHHHHLDCPLPQPCPHRLLSAAQTSIKRAFLSRQRFLDLCRSRAFTTSASSRPLLRSGMATPTQAPTKDYDTVQTVGMTLATILFLLGILIIISKKVKCRKADSSPTCKSCKSELPSSAPGGGGV